MSTHWLVIHYIRLSRNNVVCVALQIFYEIEAIEPLKQLASSTNKLASKLAAQALRMIGEEIPHQLSPQVPLWSVEDVAHWLKQVSSRLKHSHANHMAAHMYGHSCLFLQIAFYICFSAWGISCLLIPAFGI